MSRATVLLNCCNYVKLLINKGRSNGRIVISESAYIVTTLLCRFYHPLDPHVCIPPQQ